MIEGIPDSILRLLDRLRMAGFASYLVGGCVRDLLLGISPKDWDICTSALPQDLLELFPSCIPLGLKFGTIGMQSCEGIVQITSFRIEGGYTDHRHPQVSFTSSLHLDLQRRDFSINSMAYHPQEGLIDPFNGVQDLHDKILRCVGDPRIRFQEDALRILRLVRFSSTLGFQAQSQTLQSALAQAHTLHLISKERIQDELIRILKAEFWDVFFPLYRPIFAQVIPEIPRARKHKIQNPSLLFAFLLEGDAGALRRLKFGKTLIERTETLLQYKHTQIKADAIAIKMLLHRIGYDCFMALLELKKLEGENTKELYRITQNIMIEDQCFALKDLAIDGKDLIGIGAVREEIGETLQELLLQVIQEQIPNTTEALLTYASTYLACKRGHRDPHLKAPPHDQNHA